MINLINMSGWIGRKAALERLGVKPQTLYAYVSRGLVGVRPDPLDPRCSLYQSDDLEVLRGRKSRSRTRSAVAKGAMAWGEPAMETSISTVHHGRLLYRGQDAAELAEHATWEQSATLLWGSKRCVALQPGTAAPDVFVALATLVGSGEATPGRRVAKLMEDAERAIGCMAATLGAASSPDLLHIRLARGWKAEPLVEALRRTLVLLADHELNASTFAVRVAASTGASVAASLLAGLAALSGPRHGLAGIEALLLIDEAQQRGPRAAVARWLSTGRRLPGFDHPLYPSGDPRAAALLAVLPSTAVITDLCGEAFDAAGSRPNIDFALAVLTRAGRLPEDAPFRLFALGRSAGWVAQAIEQIQSGVLIRPRATYVGEKSDQSAAATAGRDGLSE